MSQSIENIRVELDYTRSRYAPLLDRGKAAMANGDLDLAEKQLRDALDLCPNALEVQAALKQVTDAKRAAEEAKGKVGTLRRRAEFNAADRELTRIGRTWKKWPDLSELRQCVQTTRKAYGEAMQSAKKARSTRNLDGAMRDVKMATDLCPESESALDLAADIELDMALAEAHVSKACDLFLERRQADAREELTRARRIWASVPGASDAEQRFGDASTSFGAAVPLAHAVQDALIDVAAVRRRLERKQKRSHTPTPQAVARPRKPSSPSPTTAGPKRSAPCAAGMSMLPHSRGPLATTRFWAKRCLARMIVRLAELPGATPLGSLIIGRRRWRGLLTALAFNAVRPSHGVARSRKVNRRRTGGSF